MPRVQIDTFFVITRTMRHSAGTSSGRWQSSGKHPTSQSSKEVLPGHRKDQRSPRSSPVPGSKPFIQHMNAPGADDDNLALVRDLFQAEPQPHGQPRISPRLLLEETFSLNAAADILDRLRTPQHGPGPDDPRRTVSELDRPSRIDLGERSGSASVSGASLVVQRRSRAPLALHNRGVLPVLGCLPRTTGTGVVTADEPPVRIWIFLIWLCFESASRSSESTPIGGRAEVRMSPLAELADCLLRTMRRKLVVPPNYSSSTSGSRNERDETYEAMRRQRDAPGSWTDNSHWRATSGKRRTYPLPPDRTRKWRTDDRNRTEHPPRCPTTCVRSEGHPMPEADPTSFEWLREESFNFRGARRRPKDLTFADARGR